MLARRDGNRPQPRQNRRVDRKRAALARGDRRARLVGAADLALRSGAGSGPRSYAEIATVTPESRALAQELKRRGFRFLGPTTVCALMEACGLINDHLAGCHARALVDAARADVLSRC